ncbi:MAG: PAS domain S-box protein [Deltaproteobacteria bacterium]|nr:PAS domain S-box protein [Deltaproteobacteria bacterium]
MIDNLSCQDLRRRLKTLESELQRSREEKASLDSILDAFIEGSQSVLKYQGFTDTARSLFELCKKQIGARSGYVALLSENGTENEVLFLDSDELPGTVNSELPMPMPDLRAPVYTCAEPAYHNDFKHSEWMKFMSHGDINLKNVMLAPLVHDGKVVGLLGLANKSCDFDARDARIASTFGKLAAIALREANREVEHERLTTAIEQAGESIAITGPDGTIQYVNPAFVRVTGYSQEEAIGHNPHILKSGDHDQFFYGDLWRTILSGKRWTGRFINRRKDGVLYTSECAISPVKDRDGGILNFVWISRDISNEVELEKRMAQAQKMEALGTLAGGIAHDFNNILSGIIGYGEIMEMFSLPRDSKAQKPLGQMLKAAYRARDLVQQILTFSRQSEHEKKPMFVTVVIKEALKLIRVSLPTTISIDSHLAADWDTVRADATQIHQLIMNLCTNAAQSMTEKGGTLRVSLVRHRHIPDQDPCLAELAAGDYLQIDVADTGMGIPANIMERIFDPYFTTKEKGHGTGLGLSVVKGIVLDHGGGITVQSEVGVGTTFRVYLPSAAGQPEDHSLPLQATMPSGEGSILLVDDEVDLIDMGKVLLHSLGYRVVATHSSTEALEIFRRDPNGFHLVITDQTMPRMTGLELAREIRGVRPEIPIILCSGYSPQITPANLQSIGIRAFLRKPFSSLRLAQLVNQVRTQA